MGVTTTTTTTYTCDRCGFASERPEARGQHAEVTAQHTAMAFNGDMGGWTNKAWLCGSCARDFTAFIRGRALVEPEAE